ncbi:MAG: hypothetical protein K6G71_09040 [Clostridiales bacterium]|nr:hypothetical protein [Clostridiales bacterium]
MKQEETLERIRELFEHAVAEANAEGGIRNAESQSGAESDGGIKYSAMMNQGGLPRINISGDRSTRLKALSPAVI